MMPKVIKYSDPIIEMAERTGLEPATPGVTGRYSNQLNYRSASIRPSGSNLKPDGVIR